MNRDLIKLIGYGIFMLIIYAVLSLVYVYLIYGVVGLVLFWIFQECQRRK